jgi:hypothetical protein
VDTVEKMGDNVVVNAKTLKLPILQEFGGARFY